MEANSQQQQHQHQQTTMPPLPPPPAPAQPQQPRGAAPPQPPPPGTGNNAQPQKPGGRGGGRGGRGRGGRTGGRAPTGGRSIVDPNRPRQQQSQRGAPVQKVSGSSGIPFGHVPAYLPGSSSLVEELDRRIMIVLRDGRHLVGNLRTFDQYSNMVLDNASERRFQSDDKTSSNTTNDEKSSKLTYYTDVPLGMYIVRGDSIVLLGQVGSEEEEQTDIPINALVSMKKLDNEAFQHMVEASALEETADDDDDNTEAENGGGDKLEWDFDKDLLA